MFYPKIFTIKLHLKSGEYIHSLDITYTLKTPFIHQIPAYTTEPIKYMWTYRKATLWSMYPLIILQNIEKSS